MKILAACVSLFCITGCSSANENICYDYYGTAVDITEVKDAKFLGEKSVANEGYVYAVISDGQGWDSLTSPEIFEQKSIDMRMGDEDSYSKISVGDSFGDLVLSEAETIYVYDPYKKEVWITASSATFDGELSMDGYITLNVDDSIHFLPDSGEWNGLPMIYLAEKSSYHVDYEYLCNAPRINLGKKDDYKDCDFTINADERTFQRVHLTFDNLTLFWLDSNFGSSENYADIVDIWQ